MPDVRLLGVETGRWLSVRDGDARALGLMQRHYSYRHSRQNRDYPKIVGPGEYMVLLTVDCLALFVWRRFREVGRTEPIGINCSIFRNEGPLLSSGLIREADELAFIRWPDERHYTYVNAAKIRSTNPGYCFLQAGWRRCGESKGGLVILERLP